MIHENKLQQMTITLHNFSIFNIYYMQFFVEILDELGLN